jgi:hypothetical protein
LSHDRKASTRLWEICLKTRDTLNNRVRNRAHTLANSARWGWSGTAAPIGVANTENWAKRHPEDARTIPVAPESAWTIPRGDLLRSGPAPHKPDLAIARRILPQSVTELNWARVAQPAGFVISKDNFLMCDLDLASPVRLRGVGQAPRSEYSPELAKLATIKILNRGPLPPPLKLDKNIAALATYSSANFYHWLIDALPRLRLVEQADLGDHLYYVPLSSSFHRQALELLGIGLDKCVPATRYQHVLAPKVYVPSQPPGFPSPDICEFLRSRLLQPALRNSTTKGLKRLYISRKGARWREIVNEDEVVALLEKAGFTSIQLERYSVADQIRLFHEAEFIAGPHGAGLVHLAFCNEGTRVLEISTPVRPWRMFHEIAHLTNLRYLNLVANQSGPTAHFGTESKIHVDLAQLQTALDMLE